MSSKDGGKAFPDGLQIGGGMTLRDYFAARAMTLAMRRLERNYDMDMGDSWTWDNHDFDAIAERAYAFADAMLKARKA